MVPKSRVPVYSFTFYQLASADMEAIKVLHLLASLPRIVVADQRCLRKVEVLSPLPSCRTKLDLPPGLVH